MPKYILTENRLFDISRKYLDDVLGDYRNSLYYSYPWDGIFIKDGIIVGAVSEQDLHILNQIYNNLINMFSLKPVEASRLIKEVASSKTGIHFYFVFYSIEINTNIGIN
jgi:hypothetical protein